MSSTKSLEIAGIGQPLLRRKRYVERPIAMQAVKTRADIQRNR
jgi:hypothetical protein